MRQLPDLCQSYSCMQFTDAIIVPYEGMQVSATIYTQVIMPMIGVCIRLIKKIFSVGHHHTTFSASNHFHEVKRKCAGITQGTQCLTIISTSNTLTRIFQQTDAIVAGDCQQGIEVCHAAAHMYGHDTFGSGRDSSPNSCRFQCQGIIYIHQNGHCAHTQHSFKTGHKRKGGHNYFIAGSHTQGSQCGRECRCSTGS